MHVCVHNRFTSWFTSFVSRWEFDFLNILLCRQPILCQDVTFSQEENEEADWKRLKRGRSEAIPALLLSLSLSRRSRARDSKGRIGTGRRMRRTFVMDSPNNPTAGRVLCNRVLHFNPCLNEYECSCNSTANKQGFVQRFTSLVRLYHVRHTTIKLCLLLTQPMFSPRCTSWTRELFHRRVHAQSSNVLPTRLQNHQTSRGVQQHQIVIVFSSQFRVKWVIRQIRKAVIQTWNYSHED